MPKTRLSGLKVSRRNFMAGAAGLGAAAGLNGLGLSGAFAQDEPAKPAEIIVRAWGGVWVDSLKAGVSDPFTAATGIAVRHDLTEDNEIQPKVWAAVEQGRVPPINVNWDTTVNATKSALRGVTEDLADLSNLAGLLPFAKPAGFEGVPLVNTYAYVYVLAYREEAFPDGPPTSWNILLDPRFKGRVAIYNDGIGMHFPAVIAGGGTVADIPENMQPAWDWFAKLRANEPLLGEDPDFTAWFQNGEIDVACTISSNAREARNNGIKVDWTVPQEGAKVDTDCLWIPKGLPEADLYWTKQYVNFALTREAQQKWLDGLGLPGVVPGLTPPADLVGDLSYPTNDEEFAKLIFVAPTVQAQYQSEWFAKVKEIMQS